MQPPRPFRGAQYDKDMFTYLPAHLNRDVSAESSRKRKLSFDHQIVVPSANMRHGITGITDPKSNVGDLQGKDIQSSASASQRMGSLNSKGYSDQNRSWDQDDFAAKRLRDERGSYESSSEYTGYTSFSGKLQSPNHKVSAPLYSLSERRTHEMLNLPPSTAEDFKQHGKWEPNLHVPTHEVPNCPLLVNEDFSQCKDCEPNVRVVTHKTFNWQPSVVQDSYHRGSDDANAHVVAQKISNWSPLVTPDFFEHGNCVPNGLEMTHRTSNGPPPMSQGSNHHEDCESNALVAKVGHAPHSQELRSYAHQQPVQPRIIASDFHEQAFIKLRESEKLLHHFLQPGFVIGDMDEKDRSKKVTCIVDCISNVKEYSGASRSVGCDSAEVYKVGSSSNVKRSDADSFAGSDSCNVSGNNVSKSVYNLETETNNLLNVLRLLSATFGIGVADNNANNVQVCGHDVKMKNLPPVSTIQNPLMETNLSKKHEDGLDLDKPAGNGEKGSFKLLDECKSEYGASAFAEKLWDGALQLSSSVTVSVIAFFKSGERMQDFCWSESVEVKGKVRLEAFEKYVQDLPRSRSRGLMVMSLRCKEGSSDAGHKNMEEVARKYREGKKVGFAKLSSDVDLYICPHSDAVITILAKHGFFKGMAAITDKCDPLVGCVVWKKNLFSAPTTKLCQSLSFPSESAANQATGEVSSSDKAPNLAGVDNSRRDKSPMRLSSPQVDEPQQSTVSQNNSASVGSSSSQLSQFKTDVELDKPVLPIFSVASKQSAEFSDEDDDLPEYDFRGAVSQASVSKTLDNPSVSVPVPGSHFQGLVPQNVKQYSEAHRPSLPSQEQKQTGHFQEPALQNMRQQSEVKILSLSTQEKKPIVNDTPILKMKNLFDDDDMPEWCPPDVIRTSNAKVPEAGFADLTSGCLPPLPLPPLPPPPLIQMQLAGKNHSALHRPKSPVDVHKNPAAISSQMQFKERHYPHNPHVPPPSAGNQAANSFMYHSPAAPLTQIHIEDKSQVAVSSQMQFKEIDYPSAPNDPPPPVHDPATNKFIHKRPAAPSAQMQYTDKRTAAPSAHMQCKEKDCSSAPDVPPSPADYPATNNFMHNNRVAPSTEMRFTYKRSAAISSQMQFTERNYSSAPHILPPPVGDPAPTNLMHQSSKAPSTQMQFGVKNPTTVSSQMQLKERNYSSAPHVLPPAIDNRAANDFMHQIPAAPSSQVQFRDKISAATSFQMHFKAKDYSPAPQFPPPPVDNRVANNFLHQSAAARSTQMHFRDKNSAQKSSQMQFRDKDYPSVPHLPPPLVDDQAANNFLHQSPAARSTQMQFGDKNLAAKPSQMQFRKGDYLSAPHLPPPPADNPAANNFMHQSPGARSTQVPFSDKKYSPASHSPLLFSDNSMTDGLNHQNSAFPPGFTPDPASEPRFDQRGMKNPIHRSTKGTRP